MSVEIAEVAKFLERTAPFASLTNAERAALSRAVTARYARSGSAILAAGDHNDSLFVVRSGAVELRLAGKDLTARLAAGSTFAYPSLLRGGEVHNTTIAIEDTLLYAIPADRFHALRESSESFRRFFAEGEAARLAHALKDRQQEAGFQLDRERAGALVGSKAPVSCNSDTSIADAVQLMHVRNVSTLAICDGGVLKGIFTDKDLRNRVVASSLPLDHAISEVMTPSPRTLSTESSAAEAMALMTSGGFRHIPLIDQAGALAGILSATDILAAIGNNAIDTGMMIARARSSKELIEAASRVPESFTAMVASGVHAAHAMRFTSALGEAVHRKAAHLAEAELGDPPCAYALVVFGSLAREEQLVGSDQDNGLILADDADKSCERYFEALGTRISDLLNDCGYIYCKGGIMAKNAEQRRTLAGWCKRYEHWISRPDEERILRATIFFDMRHIHGDASLTRRLHQETVALFKDSPLFVSYLARDALRSKVPLGIFRNLVLETSDDGQKVFDAKRQAIMPIVDIARTHALAAGLGEVGTIERLRELADAGHMNDDDAQSLEDAMLLVNEMRIAHQAGQVGRGEAPDNLIAPDALSPLERDYLKDAFAVIRSALDALRRNFAGGIA
ncbi:MAG: putative nucleotidyltransferase substrate binding domain-containing protein [Erythrobacter sp.]